MDGKGVEERMKDMFIVGGDSHKGENKERRNKVRTCFFFTDYVDLELQIKQKAEAGLMGDSKRT